MADLPTLSPQVKFGSPVMEMCKGSPPVGDVGDEITPYYPSKAEDDEENNLEEFCSHIPHLAKLAIRLLICLEL